MTTMTTERLREMQHANEIGLRRGLDENCWTDEEFAELLRLAERGMEVEGVMEGLAQACQELSIPMAVDALAAYRKWKGGGK